MDNPEYTFQILEVFSKVKTREIPRELEEYICYVARTGDPVFQWAIVKVLIKEKLVAVLDEFMEGNPNVEIPPCPNLEPFNFETMKSDLLTRLDSFLMPPFTIQRLCELLSSPRREYNRVDKYMRAVEKNVLVVSASDLWLKRGLDGDSNDAVINGILYNVDDSLNSVSNRVFSSEEQGSELSVSSKLDDTDAVQQMIEESWNEGHHDEFRINGEGNSPLESSFENELQLVADKSIDEKDVSEEVDSSFDNNSMLMDSSLQNIIGESNNITFQSIPKSEESLESLKSGTYEFKDDSQEEISNLALDPGNNEMRNEEQIPQLNVCITEFRNEEQGFESCDFVFLQGKTEVFNNSEVNIENQCYGYLDEMKGNNEKLEQENTSKDSKNNEQIDSNTQNNSLETTSTEENFLSEAGNHKEKSLSCGDREEMKVVEVMECDTNVEESQIEEEGKSD